MAKRPLSYYQHLQYPFRVRVPREGGYFADFPDLPGLVTDADRLEDLPAMIVEALSLWLEVSHEQGHDIPVPTVWDYESEYSGKFNVRLPSSLHEMLAESAGRDGVSLNQYVVSLLSRGDAQARIEERLARVEAALGGGATAGVARVADEVRREGPLRYE